MAYFPVVLDTCVLYPQLIRDVLLHAAAAGLFAPYWSSRTIEELRDNLLEKGKDPVKIDRTLALMQQHFPGAERIVPDGLVAAMTNDAKDRHVLAAAVMVRADLVVTDNVADFPAESRERYDISIRTADEFLLDLLDLNRDAMVQLIERRRQSYLNPPYTRAEMVARLGIAAPRFAMAIDEAFETAGLSTRSAG